jgi:hypothetical protein
MEKSSIEVAGSLLTIKRMRRALRAMGLRKQKLAVFSGSI